MLTKPPLRVDFLWKEGVTSAPPASEYCIHEQPRAALTVIKTFYEISEEYISHDGHEQKHRCETRQRAEPENSHKESLSSFASENWWTDATCPPNWLWWLSHLGRMRQEITRRAAGMELPERHQQLSHSMASVPMTLKYVPHAGPWHSAGNGYTPPGAGTAPHPSRRQKLSSMGCCGSLSTESWKDRSEMGQDLVWATPKGFTHLKPLSWLLPHYRICVELAVISS